MNFQVNLSYRWISFDCYGTLIDWDTGFRSAMSQVQPRLSADQLETVARRYDQVEREHESSPYHPYRTILREALAQTFGEIGVPFPEPPDILAEELPKWPAFPEVPRVLRYLKSSGYRLAILSNVDRELIQSSLRQFGVSMDLVITAEDVRRYKPDPAHWEALLGGAGVMPLEILHVARGLHSDIPTAQGLGLGTCWVNRRGENSGNIRPGTVLSDLTDLVTLL